jgi:hypothetical protein
MKTHLRFLAALLLPLVPATRATVNPAIVSADAQWLIYADLNALRAGAIGKELIAMGEKAQLDTAGGKIGVDWQKLLATMGSATAYGANITPDPKQIDGTLVVQGTADLRKIAESLLIQTNLAHPENVVEVTDLGFPAYAVKDHKPAAKNAAGKNDKAMDQAETLEVIIAFPPEPIVIVSKSKPQILKAREVFRGSAPSLARANSTLAKFVAGADGAYLFAASAVPGEKFFPEDGPQTRIVKMAKAGSLAIGERGENAFAHSELVASSDQMAEKLMKILQGMTAMMSLAETNDKQLAEFLNSAAVNRTDDVVSLDLTYSSARLATMIKSLQSQRQNGPADRGGRPGIPMTNGRALAEWQAEAGPAAAEGSPAPIVSREIEKVSLKNGTLLTLARQSNGGKSVRFDRIEIMAEDGASAPLTFRPGFMRNGGPRGAWQQFEFPGADGTYRLKIYYVNDPEGKATYALSAKDSSAPAAAAAPSPSPMIPQPKIK